MFNLSSIFENAVSNLLCVFPVRPLAICLAVKMACRRLASGSSNCLLLAWRIFSRASGVWVRPYMGLFFPDTISLGVRVGIPNLIILLPIQPCDTLKKSAISCCVFFSLIYKLSSTFLVMCVVSADISCTSLNVRMQIPNSLSHFLTVGRWLLHCLAIARCDIKSTKYHWRNCFSVGFFVMTLLKTQKPRDRLAPLPRQCKATRFFEKVI